MIFLLYLTQDGSILDFMVLCIRNNLFLLMKFSWLYDFTQGLHILRSLILASLIDLVLIILGGW